MPPAGSGVGSFALAFVVLGPLYFLIGKIGRDAPLAVTHPEFYYGFVGLGQLWQRCLL